MVSLTDRCQFSKTCDEKKKCTLRVDDCFPVRRISMGEVDENLELPNITQTLTRRPSRISDVQNEYILHEAVIKNDVEAVREIMKEPVDVNMRNNYGRAPIHWAATRGNIEIMEMLMAARCNIEAKDKYGMRPLLMAAYQGHREAVHLLISHGADVSATNKKQSTLLMCAAKNNRLEVVNFLLDNLDNVDLNAVDIERQTALHLAAVGGHIEIVQKLVHLGANPTAVDKTGSSPLHCACAKGHLEVVIFLLHHGANIFIQDVDGNTPLHIAVENRQTHIVQQLLEHGNPSDLRNHKGQTPLHIASSHGSIGITELLVQYGCDINARNNIGNTALHNACLSNNAHIVEFLIVKGVDLDALNSRLQSALHIAAEQGYTDICKLLLAAGANIQQREQGGKTPLYIAARGSFTAIVDMIIKTIRLEYENENEEPAHSVSRRQSRWSQGPEFDLLGKRENNDRFSEILWKLSHRYLEPGEWKKLAYRWNFTDEQIKAIEHQYTGPSSYKEHCHRMLRIWVDSLPVSVDAVQELNNSLIAIDKKKVAETIIRKMKEPEPSHPAAKHCCDKECIVM